MTNKIKKHFVFALFLAYAASGFISAQALKVGENDLNFGVGFGVPWIKPGYYSVLPPISLSLDHGLRDDWGEGVFTVGGYIGVSRYAQESKWSDPIGQINYEFGYKYTSTLFAARITYHYPVIKKLDTYIGLMGGFRINTKNEYGTWPAGIVDFNTDANFILASRLFLGAKYNFNDKIGGFGELGYGISYFNLGVSFRM